MGTSSIAFSQEDYENATNVIVQFLRDSGYDGSLEAGTSIADTVIKPNALLYALYSYLTHKAKAYQSLQAATDMKDAGELDDDEYDDAVDCILSNWFVSRNEGTPATGYVRLWFLEPNDFLMYEEGDTVATNVSKTIVLVATKTVAFAESDFSHVINAVTNYDEYYVDVPVQTSENIDDEITTDTTLTASVSDIYYLRATVPADFKDGTSKESSDSYILRTKQAITTRELITSRAIDLVLKEEFPDIWNIYVAGHGYTEQIRDIVSLNGAKIHVGNCADIWIGSQMVMEEFEFTTDENGYVLQSDFPSSGHVALISSCEKSSDGTEVQFTVESCDREEWSSPGYFPVVKTDAPSTTVKFTCVGDTTLPSINDFLFDEDHRVICYDPKVRHKLPILMEFSLTLTLVNEDSDTRNNVKTAAEAYLADIDLKGKSFNSDDMLAYITENAGTNVKEVVGPYSRTSLFSDVTVIEEDSPSRLQAKEVITSYISALAYDDESFVESELIQELHNNIANIQTVVLPLDISASLYDMEDNTTQTVDVTNTFRMDGFTGLSTQVTQNTTQLFTLPDFIKVY